MKKDDIDYSLYSISSLVAVLRRLDPQRFPEDCTNARRALEQKWPQAPQDLSSVTHQQILAIRTAPVHTAQGTVRFFVRFFPLERAKLLEPAPNNLELRGTGTVTVAEDLVEIESDSHHTGRASGWTLQRRDIVNVSSEAADHSIVIRARGRHEYLTVWMQTAQDAAQLLDLLPREITPEFPAELAKTRTFHANLAVLGRIAPVTPAIIALNILVFAVMAMAGGGVFVPDSQVHLAFGSNFGPWTWTGEPWRLLSCAFIHFGVWHLAFNMYALWNGGGLTERLFGSARFALLYLLAGLSGSVVSSFVDPMRNSAGASGAIFGVYGALLAFLLVRRADIPLALLKRARTGALVLCGYSLVLGAANPMIDNAAHVGGLLGGMLAGWLLARPFDPAARARAAPWRMVLTIVAVCLPLGLLARTQLMPERQAKLWLERQLLSTEAQERRALRRQDEINQDGDAVHRQARFTEEIIKPWQALDSVIQAGPRQHSTLDPQVRALQEYSAARNEALELRARALRSGLPQDQAQAAAARSRADGLLAKIRNIHEEQR